jgi:lipopolysaccharide biosynthesis glycosyltransferase
MKPTIYTAYHKPSALVSSPSIRPIHVGRANAKAQLDDMIGDDTGDNISADNGRYCELTALYWAWKNDTDSSHIGLMHYRRLFDFAGEHTSPKAEVVLGEFTIKDYTKASEDWLAANPDVDLVLPVPHRMHITTRQNYEAEHDPRDLVEVEAILAADHPDYLPMFHEVMEGNELWLANMFVARRDIMEAYCEWLFDILPKLDAAHERLWLSAYNARYLGFMSERLFQIWLKKFLADAPETKVQRVNILNLSNALTFPYLSGDSLNGPEQVNVAFSSDVNYLPHTAAMLRSAIDHLNEDRQYNFFYLHENIPGRDLSLLNSMCFGVPNVTLHLIDVKNPFSENYRSEHHAPTNATFNRFLLFSLLPDLDRLLYIDVDMILKGDIAEIFDVEMDGYKLAAVPDFIMTRVLTTKVETADPEVPDLYAYLRDSLSMSDLQISKYFNAGLMVLNFKEMDVEATGRRLLEMVEETKYFFRDQDILNEHFKDDYLPMPARYNVFNSNDNEYDDVPVANRAKALAAKHDPFLIHYAAWQHKPWTYPDTQFSDLYWAALERTPFHKRVLLRLIDDSRKHYLGLSKRSPAEAVVSVGLKTADRFPALRPFLLRAYHALRAGKRWLKATLAR